MNGRIEKENKINKCIEQKLINCPNYVKEWIYYLKASGKQPTTQKDFLLKVLNFLKYINIDIKEINVNNFSLGEIIEKYLIFIQTKECNNGIVKTSYSYQQGVWSSLNSFFGFLTERNLIEYNYMSKIPKVKGNDLNRINNHRILLTSRDFNKIIKCITEKRDSTILNEFIKRDLCLFYIFMTTGMRESALQSINIEDIDFDYNILTIIDKGNQEHQYYLNEKTINSIKDWVNDRKHFVLNENETALFISTAGQRLHVNSIAKIVKQYSKEALGFEISPHKLRSGLCSILYDEWGDIEKVRRAIGHANITTTQRYIVTKNTERFEAANILENAL